MTMSREQLLLDLLRIHRKLDELELFLERDVSIPGPALLTRMGFGFLRNTVLAGCVFYLATERRTPWWLRIILWFLSFVMVSFVAALQWLSRYSSFLLYIKLGVFFKEHGVTILENFLSLIYICQYFWLPLASSTL
jgi:hypothetical protein